MDGDEVVLARVVPADGRSRAYVDGRLATAGALAERGARLVDLHGQHAHQSLLAPAMQRDALDRFGGVDLDPVHDARDAARARRRQLAALGGDERARARELDLLRFQVDELAAAGLDDADEDERLDERGDRLADAAAHRAAAWSAAGALTADGGVARPAVRARSPSSAGRGSVRRRGGAPGCAWSRSSTTWRPRSSTAARASRRTPSGSRRSASGGSCWRPAPQVRHGRPTGRRLRHLGRRARLPATTWPPGSTRSSATRRRAAALERAEREAAADLAAAEAAGGTGPPEGRPGPGPPCPGAPARRWPWADRPVDVEVEGDDPADEVRFLLAANPGAAPARSPRWPPAASWPARCSPCGSC